MTLEQETCPICGKKSDTFLIDDSNLKFLRTLHNQKEINTAISLTKIIWENIPQLRLSTDSKAIVDKLSETLIQDTQEQLNKILEPMRVFIETFPKIIEKLPEDLKNDVKTEFGETRLRLENEFKTLREATPTIKDTLETIQTIADALNKMTERKMEEIKQELATKLKDTLEKAGFPEPEQMKLLAQLIPATLPLLQELLRFQKVPSEKGREGELELIQLLRDYFPEDEYEHIGSPGETDIVAIPRFNNTNLGQKILLESKKNHSGWKRAFLQQVRTHMQITGEHFAILAVEVMPRATSGFLIETCPEGAIVVTDRKYLQVAYGALRSALITLHSFGHRELDFRKLFTDQKINETIKEAYNYCEWVKKIREKARRIENNAKEVTEYISKLDSQLRQSLKELQSRIDNAVMQIEVLGNNPVISKEAAS